MDPNNRLNFHIDKTSGQTKIRQLVHSISSAISHGTLNKGEVLPSVNQLSSESGYSRDTVFKAYLQLKNLGLIDSTPQKGYFVAARTQKVFMLLDDFSAFKEQLYQSFRRNLPESCSVDLLFHHYNKQVFKQLIQNNIGRYNIYIVMNISHDKIDPVLRKIENKKLLILDMGYPENEMNYLLQDFDEAVVKCLSQGLNEIQKYEEFILIYSEKNTPHPAKTLAAFKRFCHFNSIDHRILEKFNEKQLKAGQVYLTIKDSDLVEVVKAGFKKDFQIGKDFGLISYNDTPIKEITGGGITVISTDFGLMGEKAAAFVTNRQPMAEVLPTRLIMRKTL